MKDIKIVKIMIIVVIIIIILLLLILMLNRNNINKNLIIKDNLNINEGGEVLPEKNNNEFVKVDDYSMFFTVWNSFNNYIDVLKYNIDENDEIEENPYAIKSEEDKRKIIFSMLDINYKENNNINSEQDVVLNKEIREEASIIPIEIKVKYGDKIQVYALDLYIENVNEKKLNEKFYILRIDNNNSTFSIEPIENCNNIDEISVGDNLNNIESNDYNKYYLEQISDEAVVKMYLQKYKYMVVNYPEIFYDNCLEEEYKEKRFGNFDNFKKYIEENENEISNVKAMKYSKNNYIDNNEYIVMDQNNNVYIFKENSIMNFTIKLDTYTILTENFEKTYVEATNEQKVQMNIDKFIQMINRQDYRTSYACLADSFKNNYFKTEEEFKQYVQNNFFLYNDINYNSLKEENDNLYSCELNLTDLTNESDEVKKISIVMKLEDDMNFKMSFSIE